MGIFRRRTAPAGRTDGIDGLLGDHASPGAADQSGTRAVANGAPAGGVASSAEAPVGDRLTRLAGGVDGARRRRGGPKDVRRVMHLLGMLAIGLGIVAVILGWYGASHSPYLYQEIPYLISGGLLGLALVFFGATLYLGSWSLRQIQEGHRDTQALIRSVERLEQALRASTAPVVQAGSQVEQLDDRPVVPAGSSNGQGGR